MRKLTVLLACVLAFAAGPAWADSSSAPSFKTPPGYRIAVNRVLAPGLRRVQLVRNDPAQVVNIAVRSPDSPVKMRVVLSNDTVAGAEPLTERTSTMCARVDCLVAINGDFFGILSGQPVGAVIADDQLLRSPNGKHHQLSESATGALSTGQLEWRGALVPSDLQQLAFDGVNVPRDRDELVLYTPAEGATTGANDYGVEMVLRVIQIGRAHV